jgi:hypothetical protein
MHFGVAPGDAPVRGDRDPLDRLIAAPRPSAEHPTIGYPLTAGHHRFQSDPTGLDANPLSGAEFPVGEHPPIVDSQVGFVLPLDAAEPLDMGHRVDPGRDHAHRKAALTRERLAVHLQGQQRLGSGELFER